MQSVLAAPWCSLRAGDAEQALLSDTGDLLPGLSPPECDGFLRWIDTKRLLLKVALTSAAHAHAGLIEAEGDLTGALAIARRIAEIQPNDETIVRRMMSLPTKRTGHPLPRTDRVFISRSTNATAMCGGRG